MSTTLTAEIAATAARLIVEEGMEYGPAKRKAAKALARHSVRPAELPDNLAVEDEVRAYLELFCADTQPAELAALRHVAADWMVRLAPLRPHLTGAVWRGTATRLSGVHLQLFCDDPKQAEILLLDRGIRYEVQSRPGSDSIDMLTVTSRSEALGETVAVHLSILDHDDLRGALKPDARGLALRGDLAALRRLEGAA